MLLQRYLSIFWPNGTNDDSFSEYFYRQVMVTLEDNFSEIIDILNVYLFFKNKMKTMLQCFSLLECRPLLLRENGCSIAFLMYYIWKKYVVF